MAGLRFHRKGDPVSGKVNVKYGYRYLLLNLHDFCGIFHKPVRHLADMNEAVLMYADVHKRAECGDICNDSGEFHSMSKVFYFFDAVSK